MHSISSGSSRTDSMKSFVETCPSPSRSCKNIASTCKLECSMLASANLPASSWGFRWGLWCPPLGRRQRRLRGWGGSLWGGRKSLLATPSCPGSSRTPRTRLQSRSLSINTGIVYYSPTRLTFDLLHIGSAQVDGHSLHKLALAQLVVLTHVEYAKYCKPIIFIQEKFSQFVMKYTFVEDDVVRDFEVVVHHVAEVLSVDELLVASHLLELLQKALHFVTVVNCANMLHVCNICSYILYPWK